MRRTFLACAICSALLLPLLTGCNGKPKVMGNANNPPMLHGRVLERKPDTVARVTVAEAKEAVDSGEAVIVDVREPAYQQLHIKGAINLPAPVTGSRIHELPDNKLLITYCSCQAEHSSVAASQMYANNGYQNTAAMVGGTQAWVAAGYPTASGTQP